MIELCAAVFVVALVLLTYCWTKLEDRMTDNELFQLRCDGTFGDRGLAPDDEHTEVDAKEWRRRYLMAAAAYVDVCAVNEVLKTELDNALRAKAESRRETSLLLLRYRNIDVDPTTWTPWFAMRKRILDWLGADR